MVQHGTVFDTSQQQFYLFLNVLNLKLLLTKRNGAHQRSNAVRANICALSVLGIFNPEFKPYVWALVEGRVGGDRKQCG